MSYRDCFDCFRLRPDRCDAHRPPNPDCDLCGYSIGHGTSNEVHGERYCEDCYNLALDCGYDEEDLDHGPLDSDPHDIDRDEYEPGGRYFDTPSLEDHPMYYHVHNQNPWGMDGGY